MVENKPNAVDNVKKQLKCKQIIGNKSKNGKNRYQVNQFEMSKVVAFLWQLLLTFA